MLPDTEEEMGGANTIYAVEWFRNLPDHWPKSAEEVFDWADRQRGIPKDRLDEVRQARANWTWTDREEFEEDMNNFYWPYGVLITELAPESEETREVTAGPQ
jgi:hypothetical protein